MLISEKLEYCSIDLEFTGFDPDKDQILEIGFAFFSVSDQGIEIGEQWSQVFKPTIEVHEKIFGLTGITPQDLETAPSINGFVAFLSDKLAEVTLVAHNPTLDVKFLEAAGVKLSGSVIDSLELVQFILPTHHSYNLENLAHYFEIHNSGSHRALADSLTTIGLLQNLLSIYNQFSKDLREKLLAIMDREKFAWQPLFEINFPVSKVVQRDTLQNKLEVSEELLELESLVTIDSDHVNHELKVAQSLKAKKITNPWFLAVADKRTVLELWKDESIQGLFEEQDLFSLKNFENFLEKAQTSEELRFCLKVLVWMETNWQTETVLDLNLSFFGGQFKSFVVGGTQQVADQKIVSSDYQTLLNLSKRKQETSRTVLITSLQNFEDFLTTGSKTKVSWNGIHYGLKLIYNPETNFGDPAKAKLVISALAAVDLFFGLVQILLRRHMKSIYISYADLASTQPYFYEKLNKAADNLSGKLNDLMGDQSSSFLSSKIQNFNNFFTQEAGVVKWLSLLEDNVVLHSQPIEIADTMVKLTNQFKDLKLTETTTSESILSYYVDRLGLNTELSDIDGLLVDLKAKVKEVNLDTDQKILNHLKAKPGSHVLIFDRLSEIKFFYKKYYEPLKEQFNVMAQDYSGSGNKMFRNFSMFPNALLMATAEFILKQRYTISSDYINFVSLSPLDDKHPYNTFLASSNPKRFDLLRSIYVENQILGVIKKTTTKKTQQVYSQPGIL